MYQEIKRPTKVSQSSSLKHLVECGLADASKNPVDDLEKRDDAESKTDSKEQSVTSRSRDFPVSRLLPIF